MSCLQPHQLHAYVDAELSPTDTLSVEAHLLECAVCRSQFEGLHSTVETLRGAASLYEVPDTSRRQVGKLLSRHRSQQRRHLAIAAAVLLAVFTGLGALGQRLTARDSLAGFAAESHLRYTQGKLPLDIRSAKPQEVSSWLTRRLPFELTLPNYPEPSGQPKKYALEGARLLQLGDSDVAYLAYRLDGRPISLLMTSSARTMPAGGEVFESQGLAFHTTTYKGLRVITWTDRGLTYGLVSDLSAVGGESCKICHGSDADRSKFAPLNPPI